MKEVNEFFDLMKLIYPCEDSTDEEIEFWTCFMDSLTEEDYENINYQKWINSQEG